MSDNDYLFLQNDQNIELEREILVSYAQYRPISSNNTRKGRSSNRRIEIILMPKDFDFLRESTDQL
jgi:chemotaxis protein MotB